jgi:hypothetical protein
MKTIVPIDDILTAVISPTMAAFPVEQMIRCYSYSDNDLENIDPNKNPTPL